MQKRLVYNLGSEAGFFSEYNNMILVILYCLKHNINFVLYSKKANFGIDKGWQDYFMPFCEETEDIRHSKYNIRQSCMVPELSLLKRMKVDWFKFQTKTTYLTYELWDKFHSRNFENEHFNLKQQTANSKQQTTREASKIIIDKTWHYNERVAKEVNNKIISLKLPQNYIGIHIRGGDKHTEADMFQINQYMDTAKTKSDCKNIFISTDDFRIYEKLKTEYRDYKIYTLCKPTSQGYFHSEFESDIKNKYEDMILLFASMDVLANSDIFVGTYSSNIGMYLGMRMSKNKVFGVDMDNWVIW